MDELFYEEKNLENGFSEVMNFFYANDLSTLPQIVINNKLIGGHSELQALVQGHHGLEAFMNNEEVLENGFPFSNHQIVNVVPDIGGVESLEEDLSVN
ncbi:MAG: hypothetical protein P857_259 [Candidatus Xenolissoclinum pacificiensis L6]|uniref:Glutaredoxin domain-containing protein n=1 Tax=Candidatus Xenolissoclinum pacificiensis L6 TaxID=1401685 RepID=W2V1N5_9RICK|nr:MAG: hypothetical protein P857_259 [Candidatus Xenolissoclinum pacificiensis L6]